jgi:aldehyde dehydrogenase
MIETNDQLVKDIVSRVLDQVKTGWGGRVPPVAGASAAPPISSWQATAAPVGNRFGQFTAVGEAVAAAKAAQAQLMTRSLAQRKMACDMIRRICIDQADSLGKMEFEETKIGRPEHKPEKLVLAGQRSLGVEFLRSEVFSGDHGLTVQEFAPFGVVGVITPVTHSLPTLANNAISIISAGNAIVCNPHPGGAKIAAHGARLFNQAIYEKVGIDNLVCLITQPTLDTAKELFTHPDVALLAVTGGPGVVAAALRSGKRAICAGPGNPPVVVDASGDIENAARCIIEGAGYDNNLLCIAEKEVFVESAVWDKFIAAMKSQTAFELSAHQMDALASAVLDVPAKGHPSAKREFVGKGAADLAGVIGVRVPAGVELLFGPTHADHPWVQAEQMMACIPIVKADGFEQAVAMAKQAEHGYKHTSVIHSRLVDHMTFMGKTMETTLFVKNGPSLAGLGVGGEGYCSYSVACSTGEGICTPLTYTRLRRCTMVDNLRII